MFLHPCWRWTVAAALAAGLAHAGFLRAEDSQPSTANPFTAEQFGGYRAVSRPSQDSILGFGVATTIKEIPVKGGQTVTKGTLLLRGDDTEDVALLSIQKMRAETNLPVDGAKAEWDLAKVEYERMKSAQSNGAAGVSEVERARLAAEVKRVSYLLAQHGQEQEKIQVPRMQARVDKFRLAAPFDGVVDVVHADLGQAVSENEKLVRVVDVDPLWVDVPAETDKPETIALKAGDKAWVLCNVAGTAHVAQGTVIEVAPTSDPASRTRRVRVEMPNPIGAKFLLAGEPVQVRFSAPTAGAVSAAGAERK